ncbi:uncharacterized protein EAF01_010165 [Botrytis porri]|uniref:uncharacterized protein n=1 Tax=Botrytis porri TaxID=87229 RepID=UPI0018FF4C87|nr:uncharacterized protein EAF01_010165 [Botrytis porri]KAF7894715.1 hypothetical protein EAF01_010165 [Botrytis porri]
MVLELEASSRQRIAEAESEASAGSGGLASGVDRDAVSDVISSNNGSYADITEADSEASKNVGLLPTRAGKRLPPPIPVLSEYGRHADITEAR